MAGYILPVPVTEIFLAFYWHKPLLYESTGRTAHFLYFSVFIHGSSVETVPNPNLMAKYMQPTANAESTFPSATYTANAGKIVTS